MNIIFIAGTDTGAGKTLVTGLLARYLGSRGKRVVTQKWVQTGVKTRYAGDIAAHQKMMGRSQKYFGVNLPLMVPYSFKLAGSPHLAARAEKKKIDCAKLKRSVRQLSRRFDFVIIEGTGGLLVPLSGGVLSVDIVKDLKLPVILVVNNKLGAINHALLSIEALKARKMPIIGMIFNDSVKEKKIILDDNREVIGHISGVKVLGELPRSKNITVLIREFKAIGDKIGT